MAGGTWWEDLPNARALFGSVVQAASEHAQTSEVWDSVRSDAASQAEHILGVTLGRDPTADEIAAKSTELLGGISGSIMSQMRGAAGQLVAAHESLSSASIDEQITSSHIGRAPWSVTSNVAGVKEQYRIRIKRTITVKGFTEIERDEWATYNLSGPLSNLGNAISQANSLFEGADYNKTARIKQVLDYSLEAV